MDALAPGGELDRVDKRQDVELKRIYAMWLLWGIGLQLAIADIAFFIYGFWNGWDISAPVMSVWLSATVVEVIAVALVVTRYLFPNRGG